MDQTISTRLMETVHTTQRQVALEDLTGMRERTQSRKAQRYHHSWAFYQLRQCVVYKAQDAGVPLVLIHPASTSQACHGCGNRGHRHALKVAHTRCGFVGDADWNAACNVGHSRGRLERGLHTRHLSRRESCGALAPADPYNTPNSL